MADDWELTLDPTVLLPGRTAAATVTYRPPRDHDARAVRAALRGVERWRYDTTETTHDARGRMTTRRVTRTEERDLHRIDWELAQATRFACGQPVSWSFQLPVPELGPASFEGEVLRCDWRLEAWADLPMRPDPRGSWTLPLAQPMALLRAGVVSTGQHGLFETAPTNVDAYPAQIKLDPVPLNLQGPFSGEFTVETQEPIDVQEVRVELRVAVKVTVPGGHSEEILAGQGRLETTNGRFGGGFATHRFHGDAPGVWLPSVDLPHGTARGEMHIIVARRMARDIHYVRDVALATTDRL